MRAIGICFAVTLAAAVAAAQQPGQTITYRSEADVMALIAKAKAQDAKKAQPTIAQRILALAPYNTNLEYRTSVGPSSVHEKEAELFYVIDGSGTLTTGGKLTGERRTNATNLSGTGIEGGHDQVVHKGDFVIVPENTPHWFSKIDGTLILMSMHLPRPVPEEK